MNYNIQHNEPWLNHRGVHDQIDKVTSRKGYYNEFIILHLIYFLSSLSIHYSNHDFISIIFTIL